MKKGFTLIELLAVMIILSLILLIAVPTVLNIINNSRDKSKIISKEAYLNAVKQAIATKNLNERFNPESCDVNEDGNLTCTENGKEVELAVDVKGIKPCGGSITLKNREITNESLSYCESEEEQLPGDEPSLVPEPESFATDTWETVVKAVHDGNTSKYKVGDTKTVTLKGGEFDGTKEYTVRIANTSTPTECSNSDFSQSACGFVIEFVDIISKHAINNNGSNSGGWEKSEMRTYLNEGDSVLNALPQELQDGIINTRVVSGHENGVNTNYTTTDKLYLLSGREIYQDANNSLATRDTGWNNTRQLDYYEQAGVSGTSNSKTIKKYNGSTTWWWLRSFDTSTSGFNFVHESGELISSTADNTYGVSPAFRIGQN